MVQVPFSGKTPRVGLIGTGGRGTSLLNNLLAADVQVAALCDIVPEKAQHASELVTKAGQPSPAVYTEGDHAFEKLLARDDVDATFMPRPGTGTHPWPYMQ
jgi:predicted dehydrogenase